MLLSFLLQVDVGGGDGGWLVRLNQLLALGGTPALSLAIGGTTLWNGNNNNNAKEKNEIYD